MPATCSRGQRRADRRGQGRPPATATTASCSTRPSRSGWCPSWVRFGGSVFAEDGITPTLEHRGHGSALNFLHGAQVHRPGHARRGRLQRRRRHVQERRQARRRSAASLAPPRRSAPTAWQPVINGDWTLGDYAAVSPTCAPSPDHGLTGPSRTRPARSSWSAPRSPRMPPSRPPSSTSSSAPPTRTNQVDMVEALRRLPGNNEAIADPIVTGDPLLAGAAAAVQHGVAQPTNLEMRCVFDSMTAGVRDMFSSADADPAAVAAHDAAGGRRRCRTGRRVRPGLSPELSVPDSASGAPVASDRGPDRIARQRRHVGGGTCSTGTRSPPRSQRRRRRRWSCWSWPWPSSRCSSTSSSSAGARPAGPADHAPRRRPSSDCWCCTSTRCCGSSTSRSPR